MTKDKVNPIGLQSAAIVCAHVATNAKPIRLAERTEPLDDADSGWQFCCGEEDEVQGGQAQVWSIQEVLQLEPSLSQFIDLPAEITLTRAEAGGAWSLLLAD